jgi:cyclopropane-fatty-acyl-phospholipid synthase
LPRRTIWSRGASAKITRRRAPLRLHDDWTIKHWREAFDARRAESVAMMGERCCRMWDFYLASVELGFLHGANLVFQLMLSEKRDDVPVVRDYILDEERRLNAVGER